jgi:hypothetical protein
MESAAPTAAVARSEMVRRVTMQERVGERAFLGRGRGRMN